MIGGGAITSESTPVFDPGVALGSNRSAVSLLRRIADRNCQQTCSPLLIHGAVGSGKTHLLNVVHAATADRKRKHWDAVELLQTQSSVERTALWQEALAVELLLVDDVDLLFDAHSVADELACLVDRCVRRGTCVVVTSSTPPANFGSVGRRLKEQIRGGVTVALHYPDLTERCAMVAHFSGGLALPAEVTDWLANRVPEDLRRLRACTLQLLSMQVESQARVDVARARAVLEEAGLIAAISASTRIDEVPPPSRRSSGVFAQGDGAVARKARFKQMLTEAENDDEERLALEIALGERIRELRSENVTDERLTKFVRALSLLREGNLEEALQVATA